MPYRIPTADERKALFEGLKQRSSLTTWQRLFEHYCHFLKTLRVPFERSQNHPHPKFGPLINSSDMSLFYRCQAAFEHALRRLKTGDRRCFAWAYRSGHFAEGLRGFDAWYTRYERLLTGFSEFPPTELPEWPVIEAQLEQFYDLSHRAGLILQPRHLDVPAGVEDPERRFRVGPSGPSGHFSKIYHRGTDKLPEVPIIDPPVLVKTGQTVPNDGIWEPCDVQYTPGFHGLFVKPILPADFAQIPIAGCMNYLLAGHPAPTMEFEEDTSRNEGKPTTWRLIWIDDRYGNNPTPPEEANYDVIPPLDNSP